MPTMGSTPRFAKDRVIQASHPFRSARADVSSHPFYDSPGPPTRSWPDVTPRPRTAPQTKERPPPVEVPHTPAAHGYAGESPYAAIEVGTFTVDPHTNRLQILPDTALAKEMNGRLEVARQALVYARREGNMRSMREAADEFLRAERDQTSHVINAHRTLAHDLAFAEAERWRLQAALTDANAIIRSACAEASQVSAERDEALEAHRKTSVDLDDTGRELAAAQLQGVNAETELKNLRTQLTLASNQLAGVQMQYDAERSRHADGEVDREALRLSVEHANERADAAVSAALEMQARVGRLEEELGQLQLLRATLISKFELKDEQLAQMQAAHREARAEVHEARRQLRELQQEPDRPSMLSEHVPGARSRIEVFREAQKELRSVRQQAKNAHPEFGPAQVPVRMGVS